MSSDDANERVDMVKNEDPRHLVQLDVGGDVGDGEPGRPSGDGEDERIQSASSSREAACRLRRPMAGTAQTEGAAPEDHGRERGAIGQIPDLSQRVRWRRLSTQEVSTVLACGEFDPELLRPGDDRPEQQLIVKRG